MIDSHSRKSLKLHTLFFHVLLVGVMKPSRRVLVLHSMGRVGRSNKALSRRVPEIFYSMRALEVMMTSMMVMWRCWHWCCVTFLQTTEFSSFFSFLVVVSLFSLECAWHTCSLSVLSLECAWHTCSLSVLCLECVWHTCSLSSSQYSRTWVHQEGSALFTTGWCGEGVFLTAVFIFELYYFCSTYYCRGRKFPSVNNFVQLQRKGVCLVENFVHGS